MALLVKVHDECLHGVASSQEELSDLVFGLGFAAYMHQIFVKDEEAIASLTFLDRECCYDNANNSGFCSHPCIK